MQTHPPSIGNNVKLNPLAIANDSIAYKNNFISLNNVEPSLGLPTGYTLTQKNSVYYFPVFANTPSYLNSRKCSGFDNLVFVNKNLGYKTSNPTYNVDISGSFHTLSAYIERLSATYIVPASGTKLLSFNCETLNFNTNVNLNAVTYTTYITAKSLYVQDLYADNQYIGTKQYNVYSLTGVNVQNNVLIGGSITSTNVFANSSVITPYLSANFGLFTSLTSNSATITNNLSVGKNLYANKIYGKINIDPLSQLYYNDKNQLSINPNQNYYFAVRPSDPYSTDSIEINRTTDGDWWNDYGNIIEDSGVSKPYFKNLQPVFEYVYKNGIIGKNLVIYIDEDIIEGELKINGTYPYATTPYDDSGLYSGCTTSGNLTAGFYSTEWLSANYPSLTAAGILGGNFLWGYDNNANMNGKFSYIDVPPLKFNGINVYARYEIGSLTREDGRIYYSASGRRFTDPPRKISFRTYVCFNPRLPYGTFTNKVSTWNTVGTQSIVQGRPVSFKNDTNLSLYNLCFEFNTNSNDSSALLFYEGNTRIMNTTVSLLGNGVYTYGALNVNSSDCYCQIAGTYLADPTVFTSDFWNNWLTNDWSYNGYKFDSPNYYPGYGLAIVGNPKDSSPTIVNFGINTGYTGLLNSNNNAFLDLQDYLLARKVGRYCSLQASLILDGKFNASALYQLGDNARIQGTEEIFKTSNLAISSRNIKSNNSSLYITPTYKLEIFDDPFNKINFRYINFKGSFSTLDINYNGFTNWTFKPSEGISTNYINTYLNIYNGNLFDDYYTFDPVSKKIDLTNSLISVGHLNKIATTTYNTESVMSYVGISDLINYKEPYTLASPFDNNKTYTLNFYTSSKR